MANNKNPNIPGDKHPEYAKHEDQVQKVNDVYDGIDTAKKYIQKYNQEETKDHNDRMSIATLDNFVFRTVEDIKNIIFRKPLDMTAISHNNFKAYAEKINFNDNLNEFAKGVLENRLKDGKTFILVDSIDYDKEKVVNQAQANALGIRPYFVNLVRQNLLSWKKNQLGQFTQLVINEEYEEEGPYNVIIKSQIKVWALKEGKVTVQRWRDDEKFGDEIETGLSVIPVIQIGDDDVPPLYDLAKINITHMNRDSEVSNYTRVGGAAFLAVFGELDEDGKKPVTLGINNGLKFRDKTTSDVKWIELEGRNYEMLKDRILYHEEQMKRIAVSFTTEQENKTATQVNKESMTGESKATDYATELEEGLNSAIQMMNEYIVTAKIPEDNKIEVNKDFDSSILTPEMVASYRTDYMSGIISYEKLMEYLTAGEYFKEMTEEEMAEEKARLMDNPMGDMTNDNEDQ